MSIRNITTEGKNNFSIYSNNIKSEEDDILLLTPPNQEYKIDTEDEPKALFMRIGEYVMCNGVFNITFDGNVQNKNIFEIEIKMMNYANIGDFRIMGGNGLNTDNNTPHFCFPSAIDKEGVNSCILRYDSDNKFDNNSQFEIHFSLSFKINE